MVLATQTREGALIRAGAPENLIVIKQKLQVDCNYASANLEQEWFARWSIAQHEYKQDWHEHGGCDLPA